MICAFLSLPLCVCVCLCTSLIGLEQDYPQGTKGISPPRTYNHLSTGLYVCVSLHAVQCLHTYTDTLHHMSNIPPQLFCKLSRKTKQIDKVYNAKGTTQFVCAGWSNRLLRKQ